MSVCYYAIGYFEREKSRHDLYVIDTLLHNLYIIAIIFIFGSFQIKYQKSVFNIKLQKNKTSVIISNACFEGFHSQYSYFNKTFFTKLLHLCNNY